MTHFSINHHNRSTFSHSLPGSDYYNNNNHNNHPINDHNYNDYNSNNNQLHQLATSFFNTQTPQIGVGPDPSAISGGGGGGGGVGGGSIDITGSGSIGGGSGVGGASLGVGTVVGVVDYVPEDGALEGGPRIVAMDQRGTQHQEAYYLFFVGSMGMILNIAIIVIIFLRRPLRRMTTAFLVHASFLNVVKAAFCIPFGVNLLSDADETEQNQPPDCVVQGSSFIVLLTTSAFNMVAMICTEAYTFGETNVGGNSQGTTCCILFGVMVVYITAVILHLGPTLIGGEIVYNPDIGNCAFKLGNVTGYVANVMCIIIITFALVGVAHFLNKFYKEIQMNRPNRVSMLVRHSISLTNDDERQKTSVSAVHEMTQDAIHRARIFVITAVAFVLCWYPLFILIIFDMNFSVSPKVYQAFCFIAWSHPLVEPVILIFFDRNLNILSKFMYCDQPYTAAQIAHLLSQHRDRARDTYQSEQGDHSSHHEEIEDLTSDSPGALGTLNSHNLSMEVENAFRNVSLASKAATAKRSHSPRGTSPLSGAGVGGGSGNNTLMAPPTLCHHCSSPTTPHRIITSSSPSKAYAAPHYMSSSSGGAGGEVVSDAMIPVSTSSPRGDNLQGFQNFQPLNHGGSQRNSSNGASGRAGGGAGGGEGMELDMTSFNQTSSYSSSNKYDPLCLRDADGNGGTYQGNIQC